MQPYLIKQMWMKKEDESLKKVGRKEEIKEEPREESPPPSMEPAQVVPLPNWEDMFPHKWEVLRKVSMSKKKEDYPPNPYRYNLQKSAPKPPFGTFTYQT